MLVGASICASGSGTSYSPLADLGAVHVVRMHSIWGFASGRQQRAMSERDRAPTELLPFIGVPKCLEDLLTATIPCLNFQSDTAIGMYGKYTYKR